MKFSAASLVFLSLSFVAHDKGVLARLLGGMSDEETCQVELMDCYDALSGCNADDHGEMEPQKPPPFDNICEGTDPELPAVECVGTGLEQAPANVTVGYAGEIDTEAVPITTTFFEAGLCPVNAHWHRGTEHYSLGEYDENGSGPTRERVGEGGEGSYPGAPPRLGFECSLYDDSDPKFTTEYDWKYCEDMQVGETYEVHWPHSTAGACGTPNQYQTPFNDGVFCKSDEIALDPLSLTAGVQAQVFVIINDEDYYYPDMLRGMIVDGDMGQDITKYTGSTTGTSVNNEICSAYSPITWQVDRKCHLISASSFDKMCADMLSQRDDMSGDCEPHGARELVLNELASDNHENRAFRY